ncbi:bifunctional glutamate N-acetyltransferase/amino-acid acetyltransferase ArgJ [Ahrensia sp. R2A130]|uniref:bifunctional glutamate N-acetyltransferase/amino-acid acetyltransferase ArgJ n=1 Tax=Ahrensia sp. R2A130 TaxID=744979 RepID=UPI0001E0E0E4|nr:bifunctional glutamate N-acetyltransferase/amino-acid acetyltransferase ArgJ [Ahrensia sp. R2A130]EFL87958.1 glutamate N-acetyltransferase/amino-acid acetyltransferase [Ahrensia sp. R2A130]
MSLTVSPLAPASTPDMPPVAGVKIASAKVSGRYGDRDDMMLMVFDQPASVAGVFTTSRCPSAPVDWCRELLKTNGAAARAVVVNAGNANAFTGSRGVASVEATAAAAAKAGGCAENEVYIASTGVIGEPLNTDGFGEALAALAGDVQGDGWNRAAGAIMTTDTYVKCSTTQIKIGGETITINGIAKGSGMIAPDMATMLAFVVTDAEVSSADLQAMLSEHNATTFNAVTVDSDTSTSDTVLAFATGASGVSVSGGDAEFSKALHGVLHDLAMQVVRDGEGATKEVEISVTGAEDDRAAGVIARTIANSPLVKTAIAGEDANWGRVVMAVGKAGEAADRDRLSISFGDVRVAVDGMRDPDYSEDAASAVMLRDEIAIHVDVGIGSGKARVWTCDLTKQYVAINGDYRS